METQPLAIIYVPVPDVECAKTLARGVVGKHLAACANISGPIVSVYEWEGAVEEGPEWVLLLKTPPEKAAELMAYLQEAHPYEVPCLLRLDGNANRVFADWAAGCCGS